MDKLIIFDLDGTLVNSIDDLAASTNYALAQFGYPPHPLEKYYYFVGNGAKMLCARALGKSPEDPLTEQVQRAFSHHYQAHCFDRSRPYAGMEEAVRALRAAGYRLAVASNKPEPFSRQIVKHFFGETLFHLVLGGTQERAKKPDPAIIFDICAALHIAPAHTIMVGDSDVDIRTAQNAGLRSVGCAWGFRGRRELEDAGADVIIDEPAQLVQMIDKEIQPV